VSPASPPPSRASRPRTRARRPRTRAPRFFTAASGAAPCAIRLAFEGCAPRLGGASADKGQRKGGRAR
jgi:hypothetical protein